MVHQYKQGVRQGMEGEDPEKILSTIDSVKSQQDKLMEKLQHEQHALESDLQIGK